MTKKQRAGIIIERLREEYPDATCTLEYDAAWKWYKELEARPQASSSYSEEYIFSVNNYGLNETIAYCRENLNF